MHAPNSLLAALGACVLSCSCQPAPTQYWHDPDGERASFGMTQLEGGQLRYLFRGTTMYWANPDLDANDRWSFGCQGEWTGRGGLVQRDGAYTVENNEVCIGGAERHCHRLFESSDGLYFISGFGGDVTGERVVKVRFDRDRPLSCA